MADFIFKKYPCLKDKNYNKFLVSQFLSLSGGYIQNVALSALITSRGEEKNALGLFLFVSYLPVFLLSYPASHLVKRVALKPLLLVTEAILFAMSFALIFMYKLPFWMLLVFGGVWGTVRAFQTPAASSVPKFVCGKNELDSGVGCCALALALARAAGPVLSGVIYTKFGFAAAFVTNTISYIPSFILIAKTDIKNQKKNSDIKKTKPDMNVWLLIVVFAVALCGTSYNIVFTGICEKLSLSKLWFSLLMGSVGVGAFVGALLLSDKKQFVSAGAGLGIASIVLRFSQNGIFALGAALLWGFCDYLFFTSVLRNINSRNSKENTPAAMGIYTAITTGALPLGYMSMSFLTANLGINTALVFSASVIGAMYLLFFGKIR